MSSDDPQYVKRHQLSKRQEIEIRLACPVSLSVTLGSTCAILPEVYFSRWDLLEFSFLWLHIGIYRGPKYR